MINNNDNINKEEQLINEKIDILSPINGELFYDPEVKEIYVYTEDAVDNGDYLTINERLLSINKNDNIETIEDILSNIEFDELYYRKGENDERILSTTILQ